MESCRCVNGPSDERCFGVVDCRSRHRGRAIPSEGLARSSLGLPGRGAAGGVRLAAHRPSVERGQEGYRRLSVSDRHDAAGGIGSPGRRVRLAGHTGRQRRPWIAKAAVHAGVWRRRVGDGVSFERRHGRGADSGGLRGGKEGEDRSAPVFVHLRVYRQCGQLRATHLKPGQSRRVWKASAAIAALAADVCASIGSFHRCDLCGFAMVGAKGPGR